jgi:hypothetical protein
MIRVLMLAAIAATISLPRSQAAEPLRGTYVEARTCQVYTGPCFANGEVGSTGKDAIMTWHIKSGDWNGVELKGHSVALIVQASHTLGFNGFDDAAKTRAILIVDQTAGQKDAAALQEFALAQTGLQSSQLAEVYQRDIEMNFDMTEITATVNVEDFASLSTRKARKGDCICSNESAYYPPLTKLKGFVPGVTLEGDVSARRLGARWSIPDSRTAYLGTFDVDSASLQLAKNF